MEKSRKPKIRFKGFTSDWEQRKLGELLTRYTDEVNVPHNGYERLGIRSHAKGTFHSYVSEGHELQTGKMHKVAADKFIVNITFGWEHAVAVTDKNDAGKLVSHRFPQYSLSENLYSKFFKYIILDDKFKHHLWLSSPGGAGRNRVLKLDEMLEYKIKIPNVQEQQKIAEVLMDLDHLITLHQRKLDKLINVKKSMLEKMFPKQGSTVPEIRFSGFTHDWEQRKLSDEVSSIDTGKSEFDAKESGDYEILGSTGVIGYDDSFDYEGDFLLTARVGANAGTLYRHSGKVKITDNTVFLQGSHIDFVFYLLNKFDLKKMSFGSGQPLIKASELKYLELMMPVQNEEKEKMATYFLNLDSLITLHQRKLEKLKNIKKSMLEKMFI